jgi:hypothetical protein
VLDRRGAVDFFPILGYLENHDPGNFDASVYPRIMGYLARETQIRAPADGFAGKGFDR